MKAIKLLELQGVIGVSTGYDSWNGNCRVTVLVEKKLSEKQIMKKIKDKNTPWTEKDFIKKGTKVRVGLRNKKVDIVEIGIVRALADRKKYDPMVGGCEISSKRLRHVGTAGSLITYWEYHSKNKKYVLLGRFKSFIPLFRHFGIKVYPKFGFITNCHVTQKNVLYPQVTDILQPGIRGRKIGECVYSIRISDKKKNHFDCSIIRCDVPYSRIIPFIGVPNGIKRSKVGDVVHKKGRTTRYTKGKCLAKNVTIMGIVGYPGTKKGITFVQVDIYSRMSAAGDSGSMIFSKNDNKAVGLLFAGNDNVTMALDAKKCLNACGCKLYVS